MWIMHIEWWQRSPNTDGLWSWKDGGHDTRSSVPFELNTHQQLETRDKASECLEDKVLEGKALEEMIFKFQKL